MADLRGNPWSFLPADQAVTTAITSIVRNGDASALVTTTAVHGLAPENFISIQGTTVAGWQKGYRVLTVPSTTTFLIAITTDQHLLANNGANGNVVTLIYRELIEVTQMLWDATAGTLLVTDQFGRTVWNPTAGASGPATYMKAFPINGLCLNTIGSGILQISI